MADKNPIKIKEQLAKLEELQAKAPPFITSPDPDADDFYAACREMPFPAVLVAWDGMERDATFTDPAGECAPFKYRDAWEADQRELQRLNALINQIGEEHRAIVEKLPTTADGVPVAMGDIVWHPQLGDLRVYWDVLPRCGGATGWVGVERNDLEEDRPDATVALSECYSTREAALAAQVTP